MARDNIHVLHRGIAEQPRDFAGPRFVPSPERKLSLLERVSEFISSDRGFSFFLGFYSGAMFCCGTMILAVVLK